MVTYVVACGSKKEDYSTMAKNMYTGSYFKACLKYALHFSDNVYILSAKYGLLELNTVIEPYNILITDIEVIKQETVKQQALDFGILENDIIVIGGKKYVKFAEKIWKNVTCPLSGGLLQQISWMNKEIEKYNQKRSLF